MRKAIHALLIAAVLSVATSFAGMAFFGMEAMGMGDACIGAACDMADHGASPVGCLEHCLAHASPASAMPSAAALPLLLCTAAFALALIAGPATRFTPPAFRWREGIGKYLRHRSLSTIVLRN